MDPAMRPPGSERIVVPPLRPVVQVQLAEGKWQTVYGLQPQQNLAYSLTPLDRPPDKPYVKNIGYGGAAGGGKSYLARAVATAACLRWPGCTGIIFRRTKDEVKANHVTKFREECPDTLPDGRRMYQYNGQDLLATWANGSKLYFGFLRDFEDVHKHQGVEYDFMVFEEATHYDWESIRWLVGNRLRATVDEARPFVLYPSNPGNKGHHWYKRLFITKKYNTELEEYPEDYAFVQAKVEHNFVLQKRDPTYLRQLNTLPEPYRSWLRDGDWEAGLGLALTMLSRERHLVEKFRIPEHWTVFAGFDWGYAHPYSFGLYAVNEDGRIFKIETITGRYQQPDEFCVTIRLRLADLGISPDRIRYVAAGHDCWADRKARGENVPTIAETMSDHGFRMVQANISRVAGLNNLRKWLQWEGTRPGGADGVPGFVFMRTEGNESCFYQLESLPSDPDNPEDALKQDADIFGQAGDDTYDETRYAIASRPMPAAGAFFKTTRNPWGAGQLAFEADQQRQSRLPRSMRMKGQPRPIHPEFGASW
jgi:hypothetical protein